PLDSRARDGRPLGSVVPGDSARRDAIHRARRRSREWMRLRLLIAPAAFVAGAIAVIVVALLVQSALADGDPASDYLISQQVFVPFQGVSTKGGGEIPALLNDSSQKGFPLRVAVISSAYDLGAVPSLFGKPQQYASFLGQEDYYLCKDELLVVMPAGYGLYKHAGLP